MPALHVHVGTLTNYWNDRMLKRAATGCLFRSNVNTAAPTEAKLVTFGNGKRPRQQLQISLLHTGVFDLAIDAACLDDIFGSPLH